MLLNVCLTYCLLNFKKKIHENKPEKNFLINKSFHPQDSTQKSFCSCLEFRKKTKKTIREKVFGFGILNRSSRHGSIENCHFDNSSKAARNKEVNQGTRFESQFSEEFSLGSTIEPNYDEQSFTGELKEKKRKISKRGPFGDRRNFEKKNAQLRKKSKGGPYSPVRFCILR